MTSRAGAGEVGAMTMTELPGADVAVNGERLRLLAAGALWWPERKILVASDLHFEKGTAFAGRGVLLPPYDTRETLRRLLRLVDVLDPALVISLGDAFHDLDAERRLDPDDEAALAALTAARDVLWIIGNHDPAPPRRFRGETAAAKRIGRLVFRHEPSPGRSPGEVSGHLHPCARVITEGRTVRRRCFAADAERLVMPAFGAYAGGLNVLDAAFGGLFAPLTAYVTGRSAVYPVAARGLAPDPVSRLNRAG